MPIHEKYRNPGACLSLVILSERRIEQVITIHEKSPNKRTFSVNNINSRGHALVM